MNISHVGSTNFNYRSNNNLTKNTINNVENDKKKNGCSSLGGQSKKNNILENLMKQKENLANRKNTIMEKSLKDGEDPVSIKEKIQNINKEIEEIDKQINNLNSEDQRKAIGAENKEKEKSTQKRNHKSNKDIEKDPSMDNILNLSCGLKTAKHLSRQRNMMVGNARELEGDIKSDERRGINPIRKKKELAEMNERIDNITQKLGKHLNNVNTKVKDNAETNTSNNAVDKNEKNENVTNNSDLEIKDNSAVKEKQTAHTIEQYVSNMDNNNENKNKNLSITA